MHLIHFRAASTGRPTASRSARNPSHLTSNDHREPLGNGPDRHNIGCGSRIKKKLTPACARVRAVHATVQATILGGAASPKPDAEHGHCAHRDALREQKHDQRHHTDDIGETNDKQHGVDPRESPDDEDNGTSDRLTCRSIIATTDKGNTVRSWSGELCPRDGGLDQNIYGDAAR